MTIINFICVAAMVMTGSSNQYIAQQTNVKSSLPISRMVDIGTHALRVISHGEEFKDSGLPTVVLEAGLHCEATYWYDIQTGLAQKGIHSYSYDRSGLGLSEVSQDSRTVANIAKEHDALFNELNLSSNRCYVAHSFGSLCAQYYCAKHPDKVKGMIAIDPAHERMLYDMPSEMIKGWESTKFNVGVARYIPVSVLSCIMQKSEREKLVRMNYPKDCIDSRVENMFRPHYFSTLYDEMNNLKTSFQQVADCKERNLEDKPLTVLIAGDFNDVSAYGCKKLSDFDNKIGEDFIRTCWSHKDELSKRSSQGKLVQVPGCSHSMSLQNPQLIVAEVHRMVDKISKES